MMQFHDIFKRSFLEGYASLELSTTQILVALVLTAVLALYIFFCYRFFTNRAFYSKSFNISLVALAVLTAAVILTIQSSLVVSLGMVGALSIVRFRTAIKDPMDLIFLFWSIGVGIIGGAGLSEIAILASLLVTILIFLLDHLPIARAPMILIVDAVNSDGQNDKIIKSVQELAGSHTVKTRSITDGQLSLVIELRIKEEACSKLVSAIAALPEVTNVSLLSHDGEVTF